MNVTFPAILHDFLTLRGESPDLLPELEEGEDSAVLTLSEALRVRLLPAAVEATLALPREEVDIVSSLAVEDADFEFLPSEGGLTSVLTLPLPDNYLRFHSLRLAGWREGVRSLEASGTLRAELGANAPAWMVCPAHPMVLEDRDGPLRCLRIYGALRPEGELQFVPMPVFAADSLSICSRAYPRLLQLL